MEQHGKISAKNKVTFYGGYKKNKIVQIIWRPFLFCWSQRRCFWTDYAPYITVLNIANLGWRGVVVIRGGGRRWWGWEWFGLHDIYPLPSFQWPPKHRAGALSTEVPRDSGNLQGSYVTCVTQRLAGDSETRPVPKWIGSTIDIKKVGLFKLKFILLCFLWSYDGKSVC